MTKKLSFLVWFPTTSKTDFMLFDPQEAFANNFDSTVYRAKNRLDRITKWLATKTASYSQDPNNLGDLA